MPNNKMKIVQQALAAVKGSFPKAPKRLRLNALVVTAVSESGEKTRHRVAIKKAKEGGALSFSVSTVEKKS